MIGDRATRYDVACMDRHIAQLNRLSRCLQERRCLNGRCAAGNERPRDQPGTIDLHGMGAFGARCVVVVLEFIEGGVERTEGVAEKAVVCFGPRRCGVGPDAVGAFVVRDRNGLHATSSVPSPCGSDEVLTPRLTSSAAEHRHGAPMTYRGTSNQLSQRVIRGQELSDWHTYGCKSAFSIHASISPQIFSSRRDWL